MIYVPCHRSHIDYLLLSYVIFTRGLMPPHIAAGANLNRVLEVLHQRRPDLFSSASRWQYVVTNSWDRVEYPALTGRSVPTEGEVLMPANLERLAREIAQALRANALLDFVAFKRLCGGECGHAASSRKLSRMNCSSPEPSSL